LSSEAATPLCALWMLYTTASDDNTFLDAGSPSCDGLKAPAIAEGMTRWRSCCLLLWFWFFSICFWVWWAFACSGITGEGGHNDSIFLGTFNIIQQSFKIHPDSWKQSARLLVPVIVVQGSDFCPSYSSFQWTRYHHVNTILSAAGCGVISQHSSIYTLVWVSLPMHSSQPKRQLPLFFFQPSCIYY
jgi:hypothetical protein